MLRTALLANVVVTVIGQRFRRLLIIGRQDILLTDRAPVPVANINIQVTLQREGTRTEVGQVHTYVMRRAPRRCMVTERALRLLKDGYLSSTPELVRQHWRTVKVLTGVKRRTRILAHRVRVVNCVVVWIGTVVPRHQEMREGSKIDYFGYG